MFNTKEARYRRDIVAKKLFRIPAGLPKGRLDFFITKRGHKQFLKTGSVSAKQVRYEIDNPPHFKYDAGHIRKVKW